MRDKKTKECGYVQALNTDTAKAKIQEQESSGPPWDVGLYYRASTSFLSSLLIYPEPSVNPDDSGLTKPRETHARKIKCPPE